MLKHVESSLDHMPPAPPEVVAADPLECFLRLKSLANVLGSAQSVQDVAEVIAHHALFTMDADMGIVALLSPDGKTLDALVQQGVDDITQAAWRSLPMNLNWPLPVSVRERRTLQFNSREDCVADFPDFSTSQSLLEGAVVVIPMVLEDRVIGAIGASYNVGRSFSEWETAFFETAAIECAQAIDRARLQEARIHQAEISAQQRADHMLRRMVDSIPDSVVAFDADMTLLAFNTAFELLASTLYGIEIHVGMSLSTIMAGRPLELDVVTFNTRRALAGETFSLVREIASVNFAPQFLETCYSSFHDEATGQVGAILVGRIVSDRVRADEALKRSLAQLADAQTVAKVGSWTVDVRSDKHDWSDEMYRLLEFNPADGIPPPASIVARYHPDGSPADGGLKRDSWADLQPYNFDSRLYLPDGKEKWVHRIGRAQRDADGRVVMVLGTVMDITERKLVEKALTLTQERLEEAQQVAHIGSWEMDVESGQIEWSKEFIRASGRDPNLAAPNYSDLLSLYLPEDAARLNNAVQQAILAGVGYELDLRGLQKDGSTRTFHAIGRPIPDATDKTIRVTHTSLDTTEHQELENQLRQVQKMETIGRFAGAIAHDFNNLLAIIMGHAELLADGILDEADSKMSLTSIQNATNRAASLTQQLLAFAHKQVNNPVVLQPNDLLVGTTAMLRPLIGQSIELITRFAPNIGNIFIDSNQLEQIIVNLVVNARDAMPKGGKLTLRKDDITLKTDLHREGIPAGRYVVISITDTGVGMTEEVQERLFEPFFTTKEKGKGTGLGLATVYGIVQQNKGYISVDSEVGVGTKFMVYFPSLDEVPEHGNAQITPDATEVGAETILVVDDEVMLRELMVGALRKRGYRVLDAGDGAEALKVVTQHRGEIDLLVSDMIMPNMGGLELVQRLHESCPDTPVLLVSGYSDELFKEDSSSANALPLLRKPFSTRELMETVQKLLLNRSGVPERP